MGQSITTHTLRAQLMAASAIERVLGLHLLELAAFGAASSNLQRELETFTSRGVPFYAPAHPQYQAWVDKAVALWERLPHNQIASADAVLTPEPVRVQAERARLGRGMRIRA